MTRKTTMIREEFASRMELIPDVFSKVYNYQKNIMSVIKSPTFPICTISLVDGVTTQKTLDVTTHESPISINLFFKATDSNHILEDELDKLAEIVEDEIATGDKTFSGLVRHIVQDSFSTVLDIEGTRVGVMSLNYLIQYRL